MRPPRLLLALVPAAIVAVVVTLLWPSGRGSTIVAAPSSRVVLVPAAKRRALPTVQGKTLIPPPATLALDRLRGTPIFVDVWASWCVPCREEAPMLANLSRRFRGRVQFVGIDTQHRRGAAQAFVQRYNLAFPHLFDPDAALARKLGVFGVPTAFLVDSRGNVATTLIGKQSEERLQRYLSLLASEPTGGT